jgi:hypothetical protein
MAHLRDDMGIDIEVDNRESHFDGPLEVAWEGTGITPFSEELAIEIDAFFGLDKVSLPPHLSQKFSLIEFKRFILLKIGAVLDRSNSKGEGWEPESVGISDDKANFFLRSRFLTLQSPYPPSSEAQAE